eukprot:SAG31_NODE_31369_length_369_cov_0.666667_1_plen_82_part_01
MLRVKLRGLMHSTTVGAAPEQEMRRWARIRQLRQRFVLLWQQHAGSGSAARGRGAALPPPLAFERWLMRAKLPAGLCSSNGR